MFAIQDLKFIPSPARNLMGFASHKAQLVALGTLMKVLPSKKPFIYTGMDSTYKMLEAIADADHKRVLLITDPGLVGLGLIQPYLDRLKELGIKVKLFDGIEPDPSYEIVDAGLEAAREHNADAILAIGGGSTLDAAKVIAAAEANNCAPKKLVGYFKVRRPMLPYYGVPTTSGTGSEVTIAAVISDRKNQVKNVIADPKLQPHTIALDPSLQLGLPAPITAATGMDALTHAVEAFVSELATPNTMDLSRSATRMIFKNLPIAYKDGSNVEAREKMLMAATYAGLAFTEASLGYVHAIAHQFGGLYHTPHGLANAIVLPHVFDYYLGGGDQAINRMAELADIIGVGAKKDDQFTKASKFVDAIKKLNKKIGIPPTLDALKEEDIETIIDRALEEAQGSYPVPRYMSRDDCRTLLENMLS